MTGITTAFMKRGVRLRSDEAAKSRTLLQRYCFQITPIAGGHGGGIIIKPGKFPAVGAMQHVDGLALYLMGTDISQLISAQHS